MLFIYKYVTFLTFLHLRFFFFQIKTKVEYCVTITVLLELEMAKRGCVQILQHGFRYQAIEIVSGKGVIETLFGQKRSFQKLQISSINLTYFHFPFTYFQRINSPLRSWCPDTQYILLN